jgi:4-phytase/acid phosphatase/peptide/nickel transport system substrate-binding protein
MSLARDRRPRALPLVSVLVLLALLAAACGGSKKNAGTTGTTTAPAGKAISGGNLRVGLESDVSTLDPAKGLAQPADKDIALAIYDPLMSYDKDNKVVPFLAKSMTPDASLKVWTMTLPTGVTFTDGTPFDADAVVKHFLRMKNPATQCTCASDVAPIVSVQAPNATTVVFTLDTPNAVFPLLLTGTDGYVESPAAVASSGKDYALHPVGTGAFKLTEFVPGVGGHVTVVKNPTYWRKDSDGSQLPYLDQITFQFISDTHQRLQTLQSGGVDLIQTADTPTIKQAIDSGLKVQKITGSSSTIFMFNEKKPPFNDVRVRQALAYATDKQQIVNVVWSGTRVVARSAFPVDSPFILKDVGNPSFDLAKAKDLLRQYGQPVSFTLECISGSTESTQLLQLVQQQWQAAGAHVSLKFTDQGQFVTDKFGPRNYQAACFRDSQISDPDDLYNDLHTGGSGNLTFYSNATVDKALEDSRKTADFAARKADYDIVQREIARDVPSITLAYDVFGNIYGAKVHGLPLPEANSLGAIKLAGVWMSK